MFDSPLLLHVSVSFCPCLWPLLAWRAYRGLLCARARAASSRHTTHCSNTTKRRERAMQDICCSVPKSTTELHRITVNVCVCVPKYVNITFIVQAHKIILIIIIKIHTYTVLTLLYTSFCVTDCFIS